MIVDVIIAALVITGIHSLFEQGMILFPVRQYLDQYLTWLRKPLYACMICMSSIYGSAMFALLEVEPLLSNYFLFIMSLAGLLTIISKLLGDDVPRYA